MTSNNLPKQTTIRETAENFILVDQDPGFCYHNPGANGVTREWWVSYNTLTGWRVSMVEQSEAEYMGGRQTITRWVHLPESADSPDGTWVGAKNFMRRFF